ncbi:MAG: hypothetical protein WC840_04155 [Candidatus Peribacteraceae bacterium]
MAKILQDKLPWERLNTLRVIARSATWRSSANHCLQGIASPLGLAMTLGQALRCMSMHFVT